MQMLKEKLCDLSKNGTDEHFGFLKFSENSI